MVMPEAEFFLAQKIGKSQNISWKIRVIIAYYSKYNG